MMYTGTFKILKDECLICSDCGGHMRYGERAYVKLDGGIVIFKCKTCNERYISHDG